MESSWNSHPLLQMNPNLVLSEQPTSEEKHDIPKEKHDIPKQYCSPTIYMPSAIIFSNSLIQI